MAFGQVIIGPAGSGKTTYCDGMRQFYQAIGRRVAVVNLDPANDVLPFTPDVDVSDLLSLERVQEEQGLGPNGGLVYCMDVLHKNMDWLEQRIRPLARDGCYFLFDCPGQVELFTLHDSLKLILDHLYKQMGYRLTAVHLVDAMLCSDPHKYISALVLSLSTMLHLELPHINVLSKMDIIRQYGDLDFRLDFYTEVQDLSVLLDTMKDEKAFSKKFKSMSSAICEVVEDFSLVGFTPLAIQDKESVTRLVNLIDKSNGYVYNQTFDPYQYLQQTSGRSDKDDGPQ